MTIRHENQQEIYSTNYAHDFVHEGVGVLDANPLSGLDLSCSNTVHGGEGCMAFYKNALPDRIAIEFDLTLHATQGILVFYLAMRGIHGEDLLKDANRLPPRTGLMSNYYSPTWALQSYHVSVCRYNDKGKHTGTSNWRRNPGGHLVGHGDDPVKRLLHPYHIRLTKDVGSCQLFVDDHFSHAFIDHSSQWGPPPDHGHFGIRLCGPDIRCTVEHFTVSRIKPSHLWSSKQEPAIENVK